MPNRVIKSASRTSSYELLLALQSIFSLELMVPSHRLFLISPWISNVPLMSNETGQMRAVFPDLDGEKIRLASILNILSSRGTDIRIITRNNLNQTYFSDFISRLTDQVNIRLHSTIHEKALITDQVYVGGSMNFTYSGVNINQESVSISTDLEVISREVIEAGRLWEQCDEFITQGT